MKSKSFRNVLVATSSTLLFATGAWAQGSGSAYSDTPAQAPAQETPGAMLDDTTLTNNVKAALVRDPQVSATNIGVTSSNGIVQLSGFASSPQEAARAASIAGEVAGVRNVRNGIQLKPPSDDPISAVGRVYRQ